MKSLRSLSVSIALFCYLLSSNVFAHLQSMQMLHPETEMVMSDCGMMMEQPVDGGAVQYDCFGKCFGDYDDYYVTYGVFDQYEIARVAVIEQTYVLSDTNKTIFLPALRGPPDERCLYQSVQTPYFSHTDTTKRE